MSTPTTATNPEDLNPFHIAAQQFDRAAAYMPHLKKGLIEFLKHPCRTVTVEFPVEMADGAVRMFVGHRVLHSQVRGPGKPLDIGGSHGRNEATARGCLFAVQRALARGAVSGLDGVRGARVAVQGFGNAGAIAAALFHEAGAKVVAVSD